MTETRQKIEQCLVGCILMDGIPCYDAAVADGICAEAFTDEKAKAAFLACAGLAAHGGPIDLMTVIAATDQGGVVSNIDMNHWLDCTPTAAHFGYYSDMLMDCWKRDRLRLELHQGLREVSEDSISAEFARAQIESRIAALADVGAGGQAPTLSKIVEAQLAFFDAAYANGCAGLRTGFEFWDNMGGLMPNSLTYLSGPPGSFKTTLLRNILEYVAGMLLRRVDFASLEQSAGQVVGAMACRFAGVPLGSLLAGRESERLPAVREQARNVIAKWPLNIVDAPQTTTSLWSWARRAVAKGSALLALDYVQCVKSDSRGLNREQQMAEISATLRDIAKQLGVPVLAISSESRQGVMRDSGTIEYDAHVWIQVKKNDDGTVNVAVKKQRFGEPCPDFVMRYQRGLLVPIGSPTRRDEE